MSTFIKVIAKIIPIIIALCIMASVFLISGCETLNVQTEPVKRATLEINIPKPLKLRSVIWVVHDIDNVTYFSLDEQNFDNLARNTEDIQNRVFLYHNIIKKQKQFYETPIDFNQ